MNNTNLTHIHLIERILRSSDENGDLKAVEFTLLNCESPVFQLKVKFTDRELFEDGKSPFALITIEKKKGDQPFEVMHWSFKHCDQLFGHVLYNLGLSYMWAGFPKETASFQKRICFSLDIPEGNHHCLLPPNNITIEYAEPQKRYSSCLTGVVTPPKEAILIHIYPLEMERPLNGGTRGFFVVLDTLKENTEYDRKQDLHFFYSPSELKEYLINLKKIVPKKAADILLHQMRADEDFKILD